MVWSLDDTKCFPHVLFSFLCGTKALVPGRPTRYLKCFNVGHIRCDCGADTGAKRVYAALAPPTLSGGEGVEETRRHR